MRVIADAVRGAVAGALEGAPAGASFALPTLPGASAALVALAVSRINPDRDIFAITAGIREGERLFSDLRVFDNAPANEPLLLQPPEAQGSHDPDRDGMRLAFARALVGDAGRPGRVFIAAAPDLLSPLPDPEAVASGGIRVSSTTPSPIPFGDYSSRLAELGYRRAATVEEKGAFAVRGGLIDVWPPTAPFPLRIDFFGDDIETIHQFDPASQRSHEACDEAWIPNCSPESLPSVMPLEKAREGSIFIWLEYDAARESARFQIEGVANGDTFASLEETISKRTPFLRLYTGEPAPQGVPTLPLAPLPPPGLADFEGLASDPLLRADARRRLLAGLEELAADGESVFVCIDTAGGLDWLSREIGHKSDIEFRQALLSGGFSWPDLKLTVLAQPDIYATRKAGVRRFVAPSVRFTGERVNHPDELRPGDLVVHLDHGIGRFKGMVKTTGADGREQDAFCVEYADGVELHVPLSQAHLLGRYIGVAGQKVTLHKLGGTRWKGECIKAQKAVVDYASVLLELQARRDANPGIAFDPAPPWLDVFEASFPFKETKDQVTCIEAVKRDMSNPRPMDRLICGDAGYGKTEVAMRAAFIAVMNGYQVAVLAPTTILAEQHYATFRERMGAFPVTIEAVSRLRTPATRRRILSAAASGSVDILIGTHAIIASEVSFAKLGLLIIDEEQRFGVGHKERLKLFNSSVDVLTLSATPIPRTLYMSMTGARDMSLLQTPPQERLEIETRVVRDSDAVIRDAITRELARDGQVFFLHNRVFTIGLVYNRLRKLVPEARITIAHGQMKSAELAAAMRRFESGECDILLSTSIVESGLDIPRANTIIIDRADRFGLAELYQLRGRVGRSSRRGHAFLLIPEQGVIDGDARERIRAMQRHGGLSGGLGLALRDLEIRGAGNLLGAEQSGHIASVGFGLYCQLLRRTVARLKGEKLPDIVNVDLLLDFIDVADAGAGGEGDEADSGEQRARACIPAAYIDDEPLRMGIYRRIAEATNVHEIRDLGVELEERFGKPPLEAQRMLRIAELRIVAARRGVTRIETAGGVIRPYDIRGMARPGAGGHFARLRGKDADAQLTSVFRAISSLGNGRN